VKNPEKSASGNNLRTVGGCVGGRDRPGQNGTQDNDPKDGGSVEVIGVQSLAEEGPQGQQGREDGRGRAVASGACVDEGGDDVVGGEDVVQRQAVGLDEGGTKSVGLLLSGIWGIKSHGGPLRAGARRREEDLQVGTG